MRESKNLLKRKFIKEQRMSAAIKMPYGEVMIKDTENDAPLYASDKNLHDWYSSNQCKEGSMMHRSTHKGVMHLVEIKKD